MSKHRTVNTHFWDDAYVENLTSNEILLFLFLITNPQTNIAGIYEITLKRMHERTKIPTVKIQQILAKFEADGKFIYKDNLMLAVNAIAHQKVDVPTIKTGIVQIVSNSPQWVKDRVCIDYPFLSHLILISSNSIQSNGDGGGKPKIEPPDLEIFLGTIEAGLCSRMGISSLPDQRTWHQKLTWAFQNKFTPPAVLECYDLLKSDEFWQTRSITPKVLIENLPNLPALKKKAGHKIERLPTPEENAKAAEEHNKTMRRPPQKVETIQ